jgi:transcriptional regulator with XRE-family HTH domain
MSNKTSGIQNEFGEKIRKERIRLGWSQEKLGFETGLDRTYISGIERGERNPSLKNIQKIAKALKLDIKDLF